MDAATVRDFSTNAIRFWEPMRFVYNAILAGIVMIYFFQGFPASKALINADLIFSVFLLAVMANVAYCAAYVVDFFAQASALREQWRKYRWGLFLIGACFAGVLTRFFAIALFLSKS